MKWTTYDFINRFLSGGLGRKKVHASYRVIEGDHCRILVKATTRYGSPEGSEIYAMELDAKGQRLVFLHSSNTYGHAYALKRELEIDNYQKLPSGYLRDSDTAIRDSGIVDMDKDFALIEFGDKPVLLCRSYLEGGAPANTETGLPKWGTLEPLSKRVATIAEARELSEDPEGCEVLAGEWFGKPVVSQEVPLFDAEDTKLLMAGVNPADYGYAMEELLVEDSHDNLRLMAVRGSVLSNTADKRSIKYKAAVHRMHTATEKFKRYMPTVYDGLTTKKDRYGYGGSTSTEVTGSIVCTTKGVYVTGLIKSNDNWSAESQCTCWYRLEKRMKRKKLA